MKFIKQSHEITSLPSDVLEKIENAARTCYKSEDKIKPGSAEKIVKMLIDRGHHAMIEFSDMTIKFITNRGVTHELVRHRLCSFAQESTRYVNYGGDDIAFIEPVWWEDSTVGMRNYFTRACFTAEDFYNDLLKGGWRPEQAREVLPNALKTEINVKGNLREWRHIFSLRCSASAHPQIRALMLDTLKDVSKQIPVIFDDLAEKFLS